MLIAAERLPANCTYTVSPVASLTIDGITVTLDGPLARLMTVLLQYRGGLLSPRMITAAVNGTDELFAARLHVRQASVQAWIDQLQQVMAEAGIRLDINTSNPRLGYVLRGITTPRSRIWFSPASGVEQPERPVYANCQDVPWTFTDQQERLMYSMQRQQQQKDTAP
jgi:hypothetical protein